MCRKLFLLISLVVLLGLIGADTAFGEVVDIRIAAGNDDGEDHIAYGAQADDGAESRSSSDLEMPWEGGVESSSLQVIGLRFADIPIPKGATILSAYVQFTGDNDDDDKLIGGPVNLIINGLLQANPGELGDGENFYTDRNPKTAAEVNWTDIPEWSNEQATVASRTPDISNIVTEIISQDDWIGGNSLMLFLRDDEANPSAATRSALSRNESAAVAPLLHIEFAVTTAIDIRIAAGNDDGEDHIAYDAQADDGAESRSSSDLEMPWEGGVESSSLQVIGLRFTDIPVPKGTTVMSAYVQFTGDNDDDDKLIGGPVNLTINGLLQANPGELGGGENFYTDRNPKTAAEVNWTDIPEWSNEQATAASRTPDISSIVTEIISQDDWIGGNALMLFLRDDEANPSAATRSALSFNESAAVAPLLHLEVIIDVATQPNPADGSEGVPVGATLTWTPSSTAVSHDVYFGVSNPPDFVGNQDTNTYYPGHIEPDTTYYWRIDEVVADGTTLMGDIWSFTTGLGNISIDKPIADSSDDGEDHIAYGAEPDDGAESRGSSDLEMPWEGGVQSSSLQVIGLRFTDIVISKDLTILSAHVQFTGDNDDDDKLVGGPVNLIINGLLQPNPSGLGSGENFYTDRDPKTMAEVNWTDIPEWSPGQATPASKTPDITSVIEEIVNQEDWASGNSMMLFLRDDEANPSAATRSALSSDGGAAPLLQIVGISEAATQPHPANGAVDVPLDTIISWWPGFSAVSHDGYIGTSSPPPLLGNTTEVSYDPGGLQPSTTYYWQIDAVAADGTVYPGEIWSFTTVIGEATQPSPADGALVEQRSATLSWTAGVTASSHDVYIGETFESVDSGAEGTFIGNQTGTTLDVGLPGLPLPDGLVPGTTYYWRVDEVEADGTTVYKGAVWSFSIAPLSAYNPSPPDGATGVDINVELSWTPGMDAKLHSLYFGDDLDAVTNAVGAPPMPFTTYNPGPLEQGKTYYWRVDEFNPPITTKGQVWSFTTISP